MLQAGPALLTKVLKDVELIADGVPKLWPYNWAS